MDPRQPESQATRIPWVVLATVVLVAAGTFFVWKRSAARSIPTTATNGTPSGTVPLASGPSAKPASAEPATETATSPQMQTPAPNAAGTASSGAPGSNAAIPPFPTPATGVSVASGIKDPVSTSVAVVGAAFSAPGLLHGVVRLEGTPPAEREITPIRADRLCGALHTNAVLTRRYVLGKERGLANVVVSLVAVPPGLVFQPATEKPLLDQVGCVYEPPVITLTTQQVVRIRNSDPFLHNVNAQARANRGFNFAQATAGQVNEKSFAEPESGIRLICNVHPWMAATVSVFPHPFHAVTDQDGRWRFSQPLPAGRHELEFNHRTAGTRRVVVEVGATKAAQLEVSLEVPQS